MTMMDAAVFPLFFGGHAAGLAQRPARRPPYRGALGGPLLILLMGGTTWTTAIGVLFCRPYRRAATIALAGTGLARVAKS